MEIGKTFCGRTDGQTHLSSNLLGHRRGDDLKIHSDISPAPHLNFTWVETSKFWLDFWHQSPLTNCGYQLLKLIRNLILSPWAMMLHFRSDVDISPTLPNLYRGSHMSKSDLTLNFGTLPVPKWSNIPYLTTNTNCDSINKACTSPENLVCR